MKFFNTGPSCILHFLEIPLVQRHSPETCLYQPIQLFFLKKRRETSHQALKTATIFRNFHLCPLAIHFLHLFSTSPHHRKQTTHGHSYIEGNNPGSQGVEQTDVHLSKVSANPIFPPIFVQQPPQLAMLGQLVPKKYRYLLCKISVLYLILICPCITTIKVQKLVYGPRSAVRGSGIVTALLSRFVTGVLPGLCVQ